MEYILGFYLVGVVITSLWVVYRLRGYKCIDYKEWYGMVLCGILASIFWLVSMPLVYREYYRAKGRKNIRKLLNKVRFDSVR